MTIDDLIARLVESRAIQLGVGYSKSEILNLFSSLSSHADLHFIALRDRASGPRRVGRWALGVTGVKRGTRYVLGEAAAEDIEGCAPPAPKNVVPPFDHAELNGHGDVEVHFGDNLDVLSSLPDASFDLIYVDPPFNTGKVQARTTLKTVRSDTGDRVGFKGNRYETVKLGTKGYLDRFDDFLSFLEPRIEHAKRLLKPDGSFFLHLDYREVHYAKVLTDLVFGRHSFINEIIWAYDYGARATNRWSAKHDNILWYAVDPERYTFNLDAADRIPYMAPGLVGPEKAARGKTPTDTWWHTIVSPNGREKTGYPTQKPLGIINRLIKVHTSAGARVLDFFAGSGTLGEAALLHGRSAVLVDNNPQAIAVMMRRFERYRPVLRGIDADLLPAESVVEHPSTSADGGAADPRQGILL